jgi:hypothetical protein
MATSANMPSHAAAPVAVVDALNSLLEAELNSIFRFMGEGSPYLSRATVEVRRPLQAMVLAERRRAGELANLVDALGSVPTPMIGVRRDEQYLAFLSLKFLLPKLVEAKKLHVERYENALAGIRRAPTNPSDAAPLLERHLAELRTELAALERAAAHVAASKNGAKDPAQPAAGTKIRSDAVPGAG